MGGSGKVVPPASQPLPGGPPTPPVGGGVLHAAVSASDHILGFAEGRDTAQSLCGERFTLCQKYVMQRVPCRSAFRAFSQPPRGALDQVLLLLCNTD